MKKLFILLITICLTFAGSVNAFAAAPEGDLQVLQDVLDLIDERFLGDADHAALMAGALDGLLQALDDPYSDYFTKAEYEDFLEEVTSKKAGIGVTVEQDADGRWVVQSVLADSPAEAAGILPGDILLQVDETRLAGLTGDEFSQAMSGEIDSIASVMLNRSGQIITLEIPRALIEQPTVSGTLLTGNIGYVYISSFGENTASELELVLADLREQGMRALLLDLRNNPGGLIQSVIDVADQLLPAGAVMRVVNKDGTETVATVNGPGLGLPLSVLVNEWSASAAEILAGAIADRTNGLLIGERTYGKGVMQEIYELGDDACYGALKITTAEFYTPNRTKIQSVGIEPDLTVTTKTDDLPLLPGEETLYPGLTSETVRTLQLALRQLSLYQGSVTGDYDQATKEAVRLVQLSQGDPVGDGVCDGWTQMLINDLLAADAMTAANQQMVDTARAWLMGQIMVSRLGVNNWAGQATIAQAG